MAVQIRKDNSPRFLEVRDPAKAIGLWSHHVFFETTLYPVGATKVTLGKFFNADLARHETHAEALRMMAAKGSGKTPARKLQEYAAQYLGERFDEAGNGEWLAVPRWFRSWYGFALWLNDTKTAEPGDDVRLSFGSSFTGRGCGGPRYRSGRTMFLRKDGRYYVAVMMKEGWYAWGIIEKTAYQPDPFERLILSPTHGAKWQTVDADIITELVQNKNLCLFEMEADPFFKAVTDERNADQKLARLAQDFDFYVQEPTRPRERFYLKWAATFNANKGKYVPCDKSKPRLVEVMEERNKDWINRKIEISAISKADEAARWVVENNGCVVLPSDASDELRYAVMRSLFYITFPDRPIDAPGGLLRGYQLPGRMVQHATQRVRYAWDETMKAKMREKSRDIAERKRKIVVDTLLDRTAHVLAARNGLTQTAAAEMIEGVDGRAVLETAAWRWGFMEGNALQLFKPSPQAGSLKLPDLSLALAFEHRLHLTGDWSTVGKLVQTARIRPLQESLGVTRYSKSVSVVARRAWTPMTGRESDLIAYPAATVRIIRDEGRYHLMIVPKFAQYDYVRDMLFEEGSKSVSVSGFRCLSTDNVRSRRDMSIAEERFDFNKIAKLAREGRILLYALDVRAERWLFDATYTMANERPCWIVPSVPQIFKCDAPNKTYPLDKKNPGYVKTDIENRADTVALRVTFTINPTVQRDGRKLSGRSWRSYCDAHPDDANRTTVVWPTGAATEESLQSAMRKVVETDGVLLTDAEHLETALDGMGYVFFPSAEPHAAGGVYNGYMIADRVFKATDGRDEWREATGNVHAYAADDKYDHQRAEEAKRRKDNGKSLADVLSKAVAAAAEKEFEKAIEAEGLSDKKTAKFFTLEAPIVIGEEFRDLVAREFRRVAYTGTMGWRQQIVRPAHEVALGIWLARLKPDPTLAERAQTHQKAPTRAPKLRVAQAPTTAQAKRLATLDALLAEGLVSQAEYEAKRKEILSVV